MWKKRNVLLLSIFIIFAVNFIFASGVGKITGIVRNKETKKPLSSATVMLEGTVLGAYSGADGYFKIINVPEGTYTLVAMYQGYAKQKISGIQVKTDLSTEILVDMVVSTDTSLEIAVRAEDIKVRADVTASLQSTNATQDGHFRGGRDENVAYMIDGTNVTDPVSGEKAIRVATGNMPPSMPEAHNTEEYEKNAENEFKKVTDSPLSTFSIDVDNASYTNVRRFINGNQLPYAGAIRVEEMINYFDYDYPQPKGNHPFEIVSELSECPWNEENNLLHIGLQGRELAKEEAKASNLVFLIDVSGSMSDYNKLPLLKSSFKILAKGLRKEDKVSIVVYAGAAGMVLPSTAGDETHKIIDALDKLQAGGSTAGGAGIKLAYETAKKNFIKNGNNRVILATDGDFNIGVSSTSELEKMIEEKRKDGIFLTVLGFGMGNYKDNRMETLADKGNGNYFYIDNLLEAKKVFMNDLMGTLYTIAKDVKIQIEFNPAKVKAYRLVGYENRLLNKEDFNDDTKDAGELGAGHTVTALYEIIPADSQAELPKVDDLKYQETQIKDDAYKSKELLTIRLRYKEPDGDESKLIEDVVFDKGLKLKKSSDNFRFSAAVAEFGMILNESIFKGNADYKSVLKLAKDAKGKDEFGYRAEFIQLVEKAELIDNRK